MQAYILRGYEENVSVSSGYILALDDNVSKPEKSKASWSIKNGTATYRDGDTSAGYSIENGKIMYTPSKVGEVILTVEGLNKNAVLDEKIWNNKTVTLTMDLLDEKNVTITGDDYILELAADVNQPSTDNSFWSIEGNVATYRDGDTSAGYSIENASEKIL